MELLAPAGDLEKLKMAFIYGADAVYLAGERFGLRAGAGNFTPGQMKEGIEFAHDRGKKVYVTVNVIPHNDDFTGMADYIKEITALGADAVIVSDPGILSLVREISPDMPIHISTQANVTNYMSARFWQRQGVSRIVAAREMSLSELAFMHQILPEMELEVFVHGAMCVSYSGRCLLSNFMCGRDANRGDCAHPCRWKYHLTEETRPGEYFPVEEDKTGTFIFNSKDLCMIDHIPQLAKAGIYSLKIEGRMKSVFYVATIVRAYRKALDKWRENPEEYEIESRWLEEVSKVSHRGFTTGFYFGKPGPESQNYRTSSYIREWEFIGVVRSYDEREQAAVVEQRNRLLKGDEIEIMQPDGNDIQMTADLMWDMEDNVIAAAPHPQMMFKIKTPCRVSPNSLLRKRL
ncbi:MAG: U32 family peptidase [Bacillota bacterium]|jgi:putative protease|nr:U32 family peptidase [Bacillota bacterium]